MLKCNYCNRDEKSANSKVQHELYCKSNPDAKVKKASMGMLGKQGVNPYHKRKPRTVTEEGKAAIRQANENRAWTDEQREKHSVSMKLAVQNNPESYTSSNRGRTKQIIYDGVKFQGNWELDFYKWCKEHNVNCVRYAGKGFKYEWNGIRTYFPDFYLPDKNIYVVVKGYKT
jgi:predicted transcriptional regulator